jgi:hypothetical protein
MSKKDFDQRDYLAKNFLAKCKISERVNDRKFYRKKIVTEKMLLREFRKIKIEKYFLLLNRINIQSDYRREIKSF